MYHRIIILVSFAAIVFFSGCKQQPSSVNLEQVHSKKGSKIISLGLGTIGMIQDQEIYVYFLNESHSWILDKVSQFQIPEKNQGILALGMGIIGILDDGVMNFYYMNSENLWSRDRDVMFVVPKGFNRLTSMKLPWEVGLIAVEDKKGVIGFYYLNENAHWVKDETAEFTIPPGTKDYVMIGGMEIGIISDNKLGIYQLNDLGEWQFLDGLVLSLPDNYDAVLSFEPGTIGILSGNSLQFFEINTYNKSWVYDHTMDFLIPGS
jgi:hypothetical protein